MCLEEAGEEAARAVHGTRRALDEEVRRGPVCVGDFARVDLQQPQGRLVRLPIWNTAGYPFANECYSISVDNVDYGVYCFPDKCNSYSANWSNNNFTNPVNGSGATN